MSVYELTNDDQHRKLNNKKPKNHRPKRKRKDKRKYSEHELRELMGMDREIYKRSNRRVRRK